MRRLLPLLASLVLLALPSAAQAYTFYEWKADDTPVGIVPTAGGLTVAFSGSGDLGGVTLNGVQTARTEITGTAVNPTVLATGPDGNVWFVDPTNDKVGRTDTAAGAITLSSPTINDAPSDLVATNGQMWVVETDSGKLDCIVPVSGATSEKDSGLGHPVAITRANDGALWYVDATKVVRLSQPASCAAAITTTPIATLEDDAGLVDITPAQTGNDVIVTGTHGLTRISSTGTKTPIAAGNAEPGVLHTAASGVWWVDTVNMRIGRLAGADVVTEWAFPRGFTVPVDFAVASDNSLWYTGLDTIGRFSEETGAQGPTGGQGPAGGQGPKGDTGTPGQQGPKGDPGNAVLGSPGAAGPQGAQGLSGPTGPRGATGATGAQGPRGKTGAAAKIPRISCKLSGTKVTCKVAKSGGSGGSGGEGNSGGGEGLRLRLSRANKLYATGSRAAKGPPRTTVRLHALRKVKAGRYVLAVDLGEDVTVHITLKLR